MRLCRSTSHGDGREHPASDHRRKAEVSAKEGWVEAESQRRNAQNINDFMREVLGNAKAGQKGASFLLVDALAVASVKAAERFSDNPLQEAAIHSMLGEICSDLTLLADAVRETKQAVDVLQRFCRKMIRRSLRLNSSMFRRL